MHAEQLFNALAQGW